MVYHCQNKFKAKTTANRDWVFGSLVKVQPNQWWIQNEQNRLDAVSTASICEYTGLMDTSEPKIEIFENDIIESISNSGQPIRHLVIWEQENARFAMKHIPINDWKGSMRISQSWITEFNKKVVGNLFDNTELLTIG